MERRRGPKTFKYPAALGYLLYVSCVNCMWPGQSLEYRAWGRLGLLVVVKECLHLLSYRGIHSCWVKAFFFPGAPFWGRTPTPLGVIPDLCSMSKPKRLTGSAESILVGSYLGLSVCVLGSKRRGGCCLSLPKERILATQDLLHLQSCSATTRLPTGANLFREEGGRTWGWVKVDKLHLCDVIKGSGFTHALPQLDAQLDASSFTF